MEQPALADFVKIARAIHPRADCQRGTNPLETESALGVNFTNKPSS